MSNNFTIASGSAYNNEFAAQFTRLNSTTTPYTIADVYGLQGAATGPLSTDYDLALGNIGGGVATTGNIDATLTSAWNSGVRDLCLSEILELLIQDH